MPIDKTALYGHNSKSSDRHAVLQDEVTRKALDLPEAMNQNIRTGLGWKELLVVGALGLGAYHLATRTPPAQLPSPVPAAAAPVDDRDTTRGIRIEKYIPFQNKE